MDPNQAVDDLKVIRQIMGRTRSAIGRQGGWIMVLWGVIWFIGFSSSQFLPDLAGWIWLVLNVVGMMLTVWLGTRIGRGDVRVSFWRPVLLWLLSLVIFDALLVWLFDMTDAHNLLLLFLLTIALGYVQFGLFTHWIFGVVGVLMAVIAVGARLLASDYFFLAIGVLGGGVLAGGGLWVVRQEE
jgi:hypothetical protein